MKFAHEVDGFHVLIGAKIAIKFESLQPIERYLQMKRSSKATHDQCFTFSSIHTILRRT